MFRNFFGQRTWLTDKGGFFSNFTYNLANGGLIQRIDDVDTGEVPAPPVTRWETEA